MLQKLRLSTRILVMGLAIIVSFALVLSWLIPKIRKNMYSAKYEKTKHIVETAWGILEHHAKLAKSRAIPEDEAKKRALEIVKKLRYDSDEYFWINDMEPRMVMHPIKPEMDGKNIADQQDPTGKRLFVAMVDVCRTGGGGFVDYQWPKPGISKPVPKISYVKLLQDWGWIIGSGIYLDDVDREIGQVSYVVIGVCVLITLGGLGLAYFMAKSISRPIDRVVHGLMDGAGQVVSASSQVSSASQSLAEGASEQAAGIEETSSSIEELSSMTKQNADNAQQANTLMTETGKLIEEANASMKDLTKSMGEITRASEETGKIIKTIDEIAFQTNLLALNAAVEAARAGEAGAGFAVVADEVRNLAMRAAEAAKNTANLIEDTVRKVKAGSDVVGRTNEAFSKMATSSKKVSELVSEIAAASSEQAQGIEQINKAVAEMDKVVQKNAASAEESASAAEEMNAQAETMKGFVAELMNLVGGSNGNGVEKSRLDSEAGSFQAKKPGKYENGNGKKKGKELLGRVSQSLVKRKGVGVPPGEFKKLKPEEVIPMEGDFREF
jgi:methyl-accepting chemotaxis protein